MPPTNDPGEVIRAEWLRTEQASQAGGSQEGGRQDASAGRPDRDTLSPGGRGLLDVRDTVVGHMKQYYRNPEAAYDNLTRDGEDRISREEIRQDPSVLGELRGDRRPSEREIGGYIAGRETRDQATSTSRQEADSFVERDRAHTAQTQQAAQNRDVNPMDQKMNNAISLNQGSLTI